MEHSIKIEICGLKEIETVISQKGVIGPFCCVEIINKISEYFKSEVLSYVLKDEVGNVFGYFLGLKSIREGLKVFSSRGRYGYLGLYLFSNAAAFKPRDILDALIRFFNNEEYSAINICVNPFSEILITEEDCGDSVHSTIQISNINTLLDSNQNYIFKDLRRSTPLRRQLNKALKSGMVCKVIEDKEALRQWYSDCFIPRMSELEANTWTLDIFEKFTETSDWAHYQVFDVQKNMIGGAFVLLSRDVLELFAMASTSEWQKKGANYLIVNEMLKDANSRDIKILNWQASNPPTGGVAKFKQRWNATEIQFDTFCFIFEPVKLKQWNKDRLLNNFPDQFIIPFSWLEMARES